MMFSAADSGLVWADPALDLTGEVIQRASTRAPAAKPAPARRRHPQPAAAGAAAPRRARHAALRGSGSHAWSAFRVVVRCARSRRT